MIVTICIGRSGSRGFPGKNSYKIGKEKLPMMAYPIKAAVGCKDIDMVYFSSDDYYLKNIAREYGAEIIDRPSELATDEAFGDDVFVHAYNEIKESKFITFTDINILKHEILETEESININLEATYEDKIIEKVKNIDFIVLMFANAPCINSKMLTEMIDILRFESKADSICTVSAYPAFSPYRMREVKGKWLRNWHPLDNFIGITCDRSSGEVPYIYDCSAAVVRSVCLERITEYGLPPQRWLGQNILPYSKYRDIPCLDIDFSWQVPQVEEWLAKYYE